MKITHLRKMVPALLVAALCLALAAPVAAFARAGGGQSSNPGFSGGGGSSFGGGGGGSSFSGMPIVVGGGGGGDSLGSIAVVIIIIVVFMIISNAKKRGTPGTGSTMPVTPAQPPSGPVTFDALKVEDPGFSEQAFYGRVNEMFMQVQQAWENRNMEPARRFLSQQQFEVLDRGVQDLVRDGNINKVMDSLHIDRIQPVRVMREGASDYVQVMITATIIDYTVNERTGEIVNPAVLGDGKTPKTFSEYWTLERRVGAQTKADASIKKCPNCGGPVTDGNYVKCAYCGMQMNDPALDWVLLRIEQP